jgi:hypothetical protein
MERLTRVRPSTSFVRAMWRRDEQGMGNGQKPHSYATPESGSPERTRGPDRVAAGKIALLQKWAAICKFGRERLVMVYLLARRKPA